MKKPTLVTVCILVVVGAACFSNSKLKEAMFGTNNAVSSNNVYSPKNIDLSKINWLQRYPQLKNIPANSQTAMIDKLRTSESISALIGPIDNPYGVRNDILDAILTIVPKDNPQMLQAAIKSEYYYNLAYFSGSKESRTKFITMAGLAQHCMSILDNSSDLKYYNKTEQEVVRLSRNNEQRIAYTNEVDSSTFGWQTLGTNLDDQTENELCKSGEY